MKKLISRIHQLPAAVSALLAVLAAAVLALVIEIGVFQFSFFSQNFGDYPETSLDLSAIGEWNGEALVLLPESPTVSFDDLDLPVRSVTVSTLGSSEVLSGTISVCDEASQYKTAGAGSFQVNPGGTQNTFTVRLNSHGNLSRLRITFTTEDPQGLKNPIFITSVTLNARQPFTVNKLRLLLMTGILALLFLVLRFRLYALNYDPDKKSCRLLNLGTLLLCLFICAGICYGQDPSHTFLRPYPTLEEIRSPELIVDAYMQQLDAFEKGQIELDLDVDPALDELENPYDRDERDAKEVASHWDRAYYNGKYYSYFGLSPLFMVYYPVYLLTGMLPTASLSGMLLSAFAILMIFAAIHQCIRLFSPRANLLLFLTGELAVICGGFVYLMQVSSLTFYYLPSLAAAGWLAAFIALACRAYTACRTVSEASGGAASEALPASCTASSASSGASPAACPAWKRILLFVLCGLSLVMLVLSRPNAALLAAAVAIPLFLRILLDKGLTWRQRLLESACPFLIPVLIGAAGIMYYNYIRFDSVFEFGTTWQITVSDIRWNKVTLSLHHFGSMLYHYFIEPFDYKEFFPFLRFTTDRCVDFGNYLYQEYSAGLFTMPLNFGVFLLVPLLASRKAKKEICGRNFLQSLGAYHKDTLKKQIFLLLLLAILALGYMNFMVGGIHIRYVCDLSLAFSLIAFLLLLDYVHFDQTSSARILYVIVHCLLLLTIGRGIMTIFATEKNDILNNNPDFYLKIRQIFHG